MFFGLHTNVKAIDERGLRDTLRVDVMELGRAVGSDRVPPRLLDDLVEIYKAAGGGYAGRRAARAHFARAREELMVTLLRRQAQPHGTPTNGSLAWLHNRPTTDPLGGPRKLASRPAPLHWLLGLMNRRIL